MPALIINKQISDKCAIAAHYAYQFRETIQENLQKYYVERVESHVNI